MDPKKIKTIIEAALMAAGRPLSIDELQAVFGDFARPELKQIREAIDALQDDYDGRAVEIKEVASGYRIQVRTKFTEFISRLWEERPPRYSRALMETLALIAYRQPITRGEIEEVRGVAVSTNIVRTLMERNWIRVVGHRDVPGKPAMFGTTKEFLDYFGLKKLDDLPSLRDLQEIEDLSVQLELPTGEDREAQSLATAEVAEGAAASGEEDDQEASPSGSGSDSHRNFPRMHLVRSSDEQQDPDANQDQVPADVISNS